MHPLIQTRRFNNNGYLDIEAVQHKIPNVGQSYFYQPSRHRRNKLHNDRKAMVSFTPIYLISFVVLIFAILMVAILIQAVKKQKKKIVAIYIGIIIIVSPLLIWGVYYYDIRSREGGTVSNLATYELTIHVNNAGNYSLLVPYLMDPTLQIETKITDGNGQLDYIRVNGIPMTYSQKTLRINSTDSLTIHGSAHINYKPLMSMADNSTSNWPDYWIYCEKTNENQNISILLKCYHGGRHWLSGINMDEAIYINEGWNRIKIDYDNVVP